MPSSIFTEGASNNKRLICIKYFEKLFPTISAGDFGIYLHLVFILSRYFSCLVVLLIEIKRRLFAPHLGQIVIISFSGVMLVR